MTDNIIPKKLAKARHNPPIIVTISSVKPCISNQEPTKDPIPKNIIPVDCSVPTIVSGRDSCL